jgi:hypothetical protein
MDCVFLRQESSAVTALTDPQTLISTHFFLTHRNPRFKPFLCGNNLVDRDLDCFDFDPDLSGPAAFVGGNLVLRRHVGQALERVEVGTGWRALCV